MSIQVGNGAAQGGAVLNDPAPDTPPDRSGALCRNDSPATQPGCGKPDPHALRLWAQGAVAFVRHSPSPDPAKAAERVLNTGSKWGTDDYDARMAALADELGKGDAAYRERLMAEIFKKDEFALSSWLTPERANQMTRDGRISMDAKARLAEGVAAAYNNGNIPQFQVGVGTAPGTGGEHRIPFNALDAAVYSYHTPAGFGGGYDLVQNAQRVRAFVDFMGSSKGPEVSEFRERYSKHLIDTYVLDPAASNNTARRDAAAGLAGNLLGGDIGRPEIATRVLAGYSPEQRKTIFESAARSNGLFGEQVLKNPATDRQLDVKDIRVPDGAVSLMLAVAGTHSADADKIAIELARMPVTSPRLFEKSFGCENRVDALTLVFTRHHGAVLEALTQYDGTYIGDEKNPNLQQYMQNASDLGALLKMTLFNPKSTYSGLLQDQIVSYAGDLARTINQPGANGEQVGRMAMLQAALTDGVRQGFQELAKDQARMKEAVGFLLDLAVSALPLSKWTSAGVERVLTDVFGNNPQLKEALKTPFEQLFDKTTGKLTDQGKKALLDALGVDRGNLEIARNAANKLNDGFMNQISEQDYDRKQVDTDYKLILVGISTIRNKDN